MPQPRPAKIDYLDFFRALAILIIVSGHTYAIAFTGDPLAQPAPANVLLVLITGGTAYFVFVSGFLYRHVFFERLSYPDFMRQKFANVGVPYLVLGVPFALLYMQTGPWQLQLTRYGEVQPAAPFSELVFLLTTGRMMGAYWYIPFIMIVFACSPLFDVFIRASRRNQIRVMIATIAIAFLVHRPAHAIDPIHSFIYFVQYYLFGIFCAQNRHTFEKFVMRPSTISASFLGLIAIGVLQVYVLDAPGNVVGEPFSPLFDLMILQKYVGIILCCGLLAVVGRYAREALLYVASISFGVFFVHPIIILVLRLGLGKHLPHVGNTVVDLAAYTALVFALSVLVVATVKAAVGRRSRLLLGS